MPQPRVYIQSTSFTDHSTTAPSDPHSGSDLDTEFVEIKQNLDDLNSNLAKIQRDDGKLINDAVHKDALDQDALTLIGLKGYTSQGTWTGTKAGTTQVLESVTTDGDAIFTKTGHGLSANTIVRLTSSTSDLPLGFVESTNYYLVSVSTDTFKLATSESGTPVVYQDAGTNTSFYQPSTYAVGDLVTNNAATYVCSTAHTASFAFLTDLTAEQWLLIANAAINVDGHSVDTFSGEGTLECTGTSWFPAGETDIFTNGGLPASVGVGHHVTHPAFPPGTKISVKTDANNFTVDKATTNNGSGQTLSFSQGFTLSFEYTSVNDFQVFIANLLVPPSQYSVSGDTLTLDFPPASGTDNIVVWGAGTATAATANSANASKVAAEAAKTAAETAETNVAALYDSFDDRYVGSYTTASEPTVDNDGNALLTGALYWNETDDLMKVRTSGATWVTMKPNPSEQSAINIVGGELVYEEDLGGIADAVTTTSGNNISDVADNETNINHVAGVIDPTNHIASLGPQATNIGHVGGQISPTNNLATVAGQISPTNNVSTLAGLDTELTNLGPKSTELTNLGTTACVADMAALGTTAMTDPSTGYIKKVADIDSNVTTVAGIDANVTTVAGISANVTTVAGDTTEINTVAGDHTEILNLDALDAEITLLGTNDHAHATTGNLKKCGDNIDDIVIVGGELLYKEDLGGVADAVTTSTGNAISDCADNETNINLVGGQISPTNNIGALGPVASDIATVATAPIPANMASVVGISSNITTVAGISANVTTVAGISSDVTAVAGDATDIGTVASSIGDVNRYANEYKIQATAPGSPSEGDLWYDETNDILKHYNGGTSAWEYNSVSVAASPMHFTEGITEALGTGSASGTTITVDLDTGNFFEADLNSASGNIVTFTINNINATSGYVSNFLLKVKQHASSAKAITWATVVSNGTNVDWAGGVGPDVTTTANAIDIFSFTTYDNGTTWYGGIVGQEFG